MAWVNSCPSFLIPLQLSLPIVAVLPVPQTPLLTVVSSNSVIIYDSRNLLPLAIHRRLPECMESHGLSVEAKIRQVSVDTTRLEQLSSANVFVRTDLNYVLIFHMFINYTKSQYEVTDANDDRILQNSLPLASPNSKFSLTAMFKTATRTIIQGESSQVALENIEHFRNSGDDDAMRNESIPLVKLTLVKLLKTNAKIIGFWCKLSSHNLIFHNDDNEVQILNIKTLRNETLKFSDYSWYYDTSLLEYNLTQNYFLHLNSVNELSVIQIESDDQQEPTVALSNSLLATLDFQCNAIHFNPQFDLVILQSDTFLRVYRISSPQKNPTLAFIKTLHVFPEDSPITSTWSPCGKFLTIVDQKTGAWKMITGFGYVLFDTEYIFSEMPSRTDEDISGLSDFCFASQIGIASNAQQLYVINKDESKLYFMNLSRLQDSLSEMPIIYDEYYLSMALSRNDSSFTRFPILPGFQKILSNVHHINGTSLQLSTRKPTGIFNVRSNKFGQLSISYGESLAISTPIATGDEVNHAIWFVFFNYFVEPINIVGHFWMDDYLVLINRFVKDDVDDDSTHGSDEDLMIDELIIVDTSASKYGRGGAAFKLDSDLFVWRHSFKSKIVDYHLADVEGKQKTLVLVTGDLRIIMMEVNLAGNKPNVTDSGKPGPKILIRVRRTIHLSSIKHKLHIPLVQQMVMVENKHFFFLLNTGDLYLLKNQLSEPDLDVAGLRSSTQTNNIYDLIKINTAIESFQVNTIDFNEAHSRKFITLFNGAELLIYNLLELVGRAYEFAGVEHTADIDIVKVLHPILVKIATFHPFKIVLSSGSIDVTGFEYQTIVKNEHLIIKHKTSKQLILDRFILHDLFESGLLVEAIIAKYGGFGNFDYCLELLLFNFLEDADKEENLATVCKLVNSTAKADSIYVNFLRKIEVKYWYKFFKLMEDTPVSFMNRLIESKDVELCYNYLIVYLNFKREFESSTTPLDTYDAQSILDTKDRTTISQIIKLLLEAQKWDECFELCRFIKLLEPSGELLKVIRTSLGVYGSRTKRI